MFAENDQKIAYTHKFFKNIFYKISFKHDTTRIEHLKFQINARLYLVIWKIVWIRTIQLHQRCRLGLILFIHFVN